MTEETLFAEAAAMGAGEARAAYLSEACGADVDLRRRVEGLLRAHDETGDFLRNAVVLTTVDQPSNEAAAAAGPREPRRPAEAGGAVIGRYALVRRIGEGGFGTVWLAEQAEPVARTVALKIIKLGMDTRQVIARFAAERQVLARMDHPNIARILDAGATDAGRPYFAMEYVAGKPITAFADDERLTVRQRLELFTQVCRAVSHAHTKGVLHRDIKASNVLAMAGDGGPVVKVIDFGIAKALAGDAPTVAATLATREGMVIGTYETMSPEQAAGSPDIDTRSDVYSLGVLLYQLLAGVLPFDRKALAQAGEAEVRRVIREVEAPRPSAQLAAPTAPAAEIADRRRTRVQTLLGELRGELEWIPLKALKKVRGERYASVAAMEQDVRNFLAGRPLSAGPDSAWYLARKFAARHRGPLGAGAAAVAAAAAGVVLYLSAVRAERDHADAARHAAEVARADEQRSRGRAEAEAANAARAAARADARYLAGQSLLPAAAARAAEAWGLGHHWEDGCLLSDIAEQARATWAVAGRVPVGRPPQAACFARGAAGTCLVLADGPTVRSFDATSCAPLAAAELAEPPARLVAARAPGAAVVAVAGGRVTVLSVPDLKRAASADYPSPVRLAATNADAVVLVHEDGTIRVATLSDLADVATTTWTDLRARLPAAGGGDVGMTLAQAALSPAGKHVALHGGNWWRPAVVWDPAADSPPRLLRSVAVTHPGFVDEDRLLAWFSAGRNNDRVAVLDVATGATRGRRTIWGIDDTLHADDLLAWRSPPTPAGAGAPMAGVTSAAGALTVDLGSDRDPVTVRFANLAPFDDRAPSPVCAALDERVLALQADGEVRLYRPPTDGGRGHFSTEAGHCATPTAGGMLVLTDRYRGGFDPSGPTAADPARPSSPRSSRTAPGSPSGPPGSSGSAATGHRGRWRRRPTGGPSSWSPSRPRAGSCWGRPTGGRWPSCTARATPPRAPARGPSSGRSTWRWRRPGRRGRTGWPSSIRTAGRCSTGTAGGTGSATIWRRRPPPARSAWRRRSSGRRTGGWSPRRTRAPRPSASWRWRPAGR